jgi:hypothetical protein
MKGMEMSKKSKAGSSEEAWKFYTGAVVIVLGSWALYEIGEWIYTHLF